MAKVEKSAGQIVIERLASWISSYMCLPEDYALVLALYASMTWVFDKFDVIPYLQITAAVKGCGKTTLAELLGRLCQVPKMFAAMTGPTFYRTLEKYNGRMTIVFDEAEKLGSEAAGIMRSVLNVGFRAGATIPRVVGKDVVEFPTFCPKVIVQIGDTYDTLRDRSIVLTLERGTPEELSKLRDYDMSLADGEAAALVGTTTDNPGIDTLRGVIAATPAVMAVRPAFLSGRDRDIWSAIFGMAAALKLDDATIDRLTRIAADLSAAKTAPKRLARAESEDAAEDAKYSEKLVRDMARIFKGNEKKIFSAVAVERLKALPDGGWSKYRGTGIDVVSLASLLRRHGVVRKPIRMPRTVPGVKAPNANGYELASVVAAVAKLG